MSKEQIPNDGSAAEGQPSADAREGKDIQKEYHEIAGEKGAVAGLEYLETNFDRNPAFALRETLRVSERFARESEIAARNAEKAIGSRIVQLSALAFRAQLYAEFRQLSERQKTKKGGFKKFVEDTLASFPKDEPGATPDPREARFRALVLSNTDRYDTEWDEGGHRTERLNYKGSYDRALESIEEYTGRPAALTEERAKVEAVIKRILGRSESIAA